VIAFASGLQGDAIESAAAILRLIDRLVLRHTGSFLDYRGRRLRA
jgi:hypothetical protein